MTIIKIRDLYNAQPFRPYILHLADGRAIPVDHPEFLAAAPSGRTVVIYQSDDTMNIVDLLLLTDLEVRPNEKPEKKNGSGRKRKK